MEEYHHHQLLGIAKRSIEFGISQNLVLPIDPCEFDPELQKERASFVTLQLNGDLRGCIGTLEAYQPLVTDVAQNAYSAAFRDPRFSPVSKEEIENLHFHISVLTPPQSMSFQSETDLLSQLQPNRDGLILSDGMKRGTFLPSVWEQLPEKADFLRQLKLKAGFSPDYWSDTLTVERYNVEEFKS